MPRVAPNSRLQILSEMSDRHVIPVIDIDRPDLKQLAVEAAAIGPLTAGGAPTDYVAPVNAFLLVDSAPLNSDLTFTAVVDGTPGNSLTVAILQPVSINQLLGIDFDGTDAIINLPTDGAGSPIAVTATAIKALWDGHIVVLFPYAFLLTTQITVVVENDGTGVVGAAAQTNLAGGVNEVLGTGYGTAKLGHLYVDNTTPAVYVNVGTITAPVWTAV